MNKSKIDFVKSHLREHGTISRNYCLRNYVSRLGAIIAVLNAEGWKFEKTLSENKRVRYWGKLVRTRSGTDYVYRLLKAPKK